MLQSTGSQRVRHDLVTEQHPYTSVELRVDYKAIKPRKRKGKDQPWDPWHEELSGRQGSGKGVGAEARDTSLLAPCQPWGAPVCLCPLGRHSTAGGSPVRTLSSWTQRLNTEMAVAEPGFGPGRLALRLRSQPLRESAT